MDIIVLLVGGVLLGTLVIYAPAIPLGLLEERRQLAAAGNGPEPSSALVAMAWVSRIYYVVLFVFFLIPWLFRTVLPGLWRVIVAVVPGADRILSGTSGVVLTAIAVVAGVALFFILAGWAFRLGWRLQDRGPRSPDQHAGGTTV